MLMMARQAKRRMLRKEGTSTLQHMTPPKMRAQVRFSSECDRMYRLLLAAMTCELLFGLCWCPLETCRGHRAQGHLAGSM